MAEEQRGFAGFDSLVSNLSDLPVVAAAVKQVPPRASARSSDDDEPDTPTQAAITSTPAVKSSSGKWFIALLVAVGGLVVYGLTTKDQRAPVTPTYSANYTPPVSPQVRPAPVQAPAPIPMTQPKPPQPEEVMAPVGEGNVLSVSQLRYCVAQGVRIDGARSAVTDTSEADINRFNVMVSDYNSRCSSYRYRKGLLESVRAEVEARRPMLEAEGIAGFHAGGKRKPAASAQPTVPKEQNPKKAVPPSGIPANAELDSTGHNWICKTGFRRVGDRCLR
ncbi:hypothetical protein SAE02_67470 [Skermanella aerolata]|uniref:Uncharacterized protein n=1 Tax=Skermanella aerolata TaxID=393310 RepID=A0A512E1L0_9PROT|nr:hypothetical protein [Skermanella aerolata]GEO42599.1 hypothetical protein SAE02_67470 [Skermanella aerolata]